MCSVEEIGLSVTSSDLSDSMEGDVVIVIGEDEIPAHTQVLSIASPVFKAMLASNMTEAQSLRIPIDMVTKEQFLEFYGLLKPLAWNANMISEANVDAMLLLSDYYQVKLIKARCEKVLVEMPVSLARLMQADTHGLQPQYERCLKEVSANFHKYDVNDVTKLLDMGSSSLIRDVLLAVHREYVRNKEVLAEASNKLAEVRNQVCNVIPSNLVPGAVLTQTIYFGETTVRETPVREVVRDSVQQVIDLL
mmetsp:Transcript_18344/g.35958  ORF Transcript_18344/g.35958 Transcript_18344/m.35958 type:complete len:249 (+) Transcript_18344:51-797(+)